MLAAACGGSGDDAISKAEARRLDCDDVLLGDGDTESNRNALARRLLNDYGVEVNEATMADVSDMLRRICARSLGNLDGTLYDFAGSFVALGY